MPSVATTDTTGEFKILPPYGILLLWLRMHSDLVNFMGGSLFQLLRALIGPVLVLSGVCFYWASFFPR